MLTAQLFGEYSPFEPIVFPIIFVIIVTENKNNKLFYNKSGGT